jgi:hypothetical protein
MGEVRRGIFIRVPDRLREEWTRAANRIGLSLAAYIRLAVSEKIDRDQRRDDE